MRRASAAAMTNPTAALAVPAGAAAPPVPLLAGRTEFVASTGSTWMTVRLPRKATFPLGYAPAPFVTVTGTADAAVVYLLPRERPLMRGGASFGRLGRGVGHTTFADYPEGKSELPAGIYDIVVAHTPGTARITVTFGGLTGRTSLRPSRPSGAVVKPLSVAPVSPGVHGPVGWTGGVEAPLTGNGFVTVAGAMRADAGGASRILTCMRPPGTVTPPPADFAPECPGLRTAAFVLVAGDFRYFTTTFLNWDRGTYAAGFAYEGAIVPSAVGGFAVWVPLP